MKEDAQVTLTLSPARKSTVEFWPGYMKRFVATFNDSDKVPVIDIAQRHKNCANISKINIRSDEELKEEEL